ncbi:MAG TPA: TIGR03620 family F420-dependent LLM class oxidoreductase [Acidimicrobiia bacterium]|nr:TIGR03620 family F420-dependent LLM class oxidoreductase [Acidimicrobiia bacterium]
MDLGRVGVWTFLDGPPAAAIPDIGAELEALGYGAVWVPDTVGRDPFLLAQTLLASTDRMVAATGVANIHARDAVTTSSLANTLAEAHPDRFLLGLGVSHAPVVERRGGSYRAPVATMRAFLDEIDGAFYSGHAPERPVTRVLAALGPKMLELAASHASGAHPYFVPPEHTAIAREALGPGPLLATEQTVVFGGDADAATRLARGFVSGYLGMPNYANSLRRLGFTDDELEHVHDRVVDAVVASGDVEAICRRVRAHLDAGADHVCVQVLHGDHGSVPMEAWRELAPALLATAAAAR